VLQGAQERDSQLVHSSLAMSVYERQLGCL